MTSLSDAYERRSGQVSPERLYVGTGLFAAGALMVVAGIIVLTTRVALPADFTMAHVYGARELAGTLVGLGVPAAFLGIFAVLPAERIHQAAAAVGGVLTLAGVAIFRAVYPYDWFSGLGIPSSGVVALIAVYAVGIMTVMWCLFTAIATFKRRNTPGGTVTMTFTRDGETHTVEVAEENIDDARAALSGGSFGGVGVFGDMDDVDDHHASTPSTDGGSTETLRTPGTPDAQNASTSTPAASTTSPEPSRSTDSTDAAGSAGPADTASAAGSTDAAGESASGGPGPDRYCGNCAHFDYVRTDEGLQPYCGLHDELMDDVEACSEWASNDGASERRRQGRDRL
ncbi:DUF7139 domain-containing protein [Halocalculus aciditolerans]|uniref:Uncharacterized protein n=1 Tax=Halocalculus aciditolerans TaxID=1383812 RepID=A0A830FML6_9EURY|nr:hypothetical protein [Halocalculus aciditolerans]GGL70705.1 hypothetical protein GCM10009039_30970 [Halocalculus aciditolerans]